MDFFRFEALIIQRSRGKTVTAKSAYCGAVKIKNDRVGEVHDYRNKRGVFHTSILAPEDSPVWVYGKETLWNAVEEKEIRKDAQLAREIILAIPYKFNKNHQIELVETFVKKAFVARGMVADCNFHEPTKKDEDKRNIHAHIILTLRKIENGVLGKKVRAWNDRKLLMKWRENWAIHVNSFAAKHGYDIKFDHRSNKAIAAANGEAFYFLPQPKLGAAAYAMERKGIKTRKGDELRKVQAANDEIRVLKKQHDELNEEILVLKRDIHQVKEQKKGVQFEIQPILFHSNSNNSNSFNKNNDVSTYWENLLKQDNEIEINNKKLAWLKQNWNIYPKNDVMVFEEKNGSGLFIDQGNRLVAYNGSDAEIDAMLQVASLKGWDALHIGGDEEFFIKCAKTAVGMGFELSQQNQSRYASLVGEFDPVQDAVIEQEFPVLRYANTYRESIKHKYDPDPHRNDKLDEGPFRQKSKGSFPSL